MVTFTSHSAAETEALGEAWGRAAHGGGVFALSGDLGAGKTALVRGLARGLGCPGRVHSPTFTLVNEYRGGRWPLFHLDLYRLESPAALTSAGLEEFFQADAVTVIEWAERLELVDLRLPLAQATRVRFAVTGDTERVITYDDPRA
jgi:tRNA threonylcarbamoyladenosine biosynthesis protein TsaE